MGKEELEWMSRHGKEVEKYSGGWIAVLADKGITGSGMSPKEAIKESKEKFPESPLVMKIPRKDEEMYDFNCKIGFSVEYTASLNLIGRDNFFEHFLITFNESDRKLMLELTKGGEE